MSYFETIPGGGWSKVHSRVFDRPGCMVDIGCWDWAFTEPFVGRMRIIGADPYEKPMDGREFYQGCVGPRTGTIAISQHGPESSTLKMNGTLREVPVLSWRDFCQQFGIGDIALLKINIEGGELDLLDSLTPEDFARIDQIAVSFHDWIWTDLKERTVQARNRLIEMGYALEETHAQFGWWLALRSS